MVSGQQYTNDRIENIFNNNPILECNDTCSCQPALCSNRVVQRGPSPHLTVGEVKGKGWAVFTDRDLHQGEFVCEYAGEVIGEEEARARWRRQLESNTGNYIMVLREFSGPVLVCKTFVDPTGRRDKWRLPCDCFVSVIGNIGRYLNHSCEPNLRMIPVRSDCLVPHLALFTSRPVEAGQELTYLYGDSSSDGVGAPTLRTACLCNSQSCKKYLPFDGEFI